MNYKFLSPVSPGYPVIGEATAVFSTTDPSSPPFQPSIVAQAFDYVFGAGEFVWARANGAIRVYGLCVLTPVWDATFRCFVWNATEAPNTANLGRPLAVAQNPVALAAGQYAWFQISGNTPINGTASVAADTALGITAAGQVGANSAGKQLLNARVVQAATATVVKASTGLSGSNVINVPDTNGLFVGGYLSGTGVGASAIVNFVDPLGKYIIASVVNSADIAGNVTQTNNNATIYYNVVNLNRTFAQGAIT